MQIAHLEFQLDDSILTQRILRLHIGAEDVGLAMNRVAGKLKDNVTAPGFRKGKAPLYLIRKHYTAKVNSEAFQELKQSALEQVLKQLKNEDKPFIPPEVVDGEKVRLRYGQPLEFALKYLVDPSGIGNRPEARHNAFDPLEGVNQDRAKTLPMGVPPGPNLPVVRVATPPKDNSLGDAATVG